MNDETNPYVAPEASLDVPGKTVPKPTAWNRWRTILPLIAVLTIMLLLAAVILVVVVLVYSASAVHPPPTPLARVVASWSIHGPLAPVSRWP